MSDAVQRAFYIGTRRTLTQDVEFAIDQLVEVAVRALSPGINDPFTAITCIDRLGTALGVLGRRDFPSPHRYDNEGRLRIVARAFTRDGVVDAAFHQIRQASRGNAAVAFRLLETIAAVAERVDVPEFCDALRRHAGLVYRGTQEGLPEESDRREAGERYERALAALGPPSDDGRPSGPVPVSRVV